MGVDTPALLRVLAVLMMAASTAAAETYYVNASGGEDRHAGTSPSTAWKSLDRLREQRFAKADRIQLKRGSVWHERMVLSSDLVSRSLHLSAYGSGPRPVLDGVGLALPRNSALLTIMEYADVTVEDIEIRNSSANGILVSNSTGFVLRGSLVHNNIADGVRVWNSGNIVISDNQVFRNNTRATGRYSGIVLDGAGGTWSDITITRNDIHENVGGSDWDNCADGIYLGHTGPKPPTFRRLTIAGNAIYQNGDPTQNQTGRGISGYFVGDAAIVHNDIHDNASAGVYLSGPQLQLTFAGNVFRNNHLRGFGWIADGTVRAHNNLIVSTDLSLTGTGIEYGGEGHFEIRGNVFWLNPDVRYGAFIAVHDGATLPLASHNTYWNAAPHSSSPAFLIGDYRQRSNYISFAQWQSTTNDRTSVEIEPHRPFSR